MKLLRKPQIHAAIVSAVSLFYALVFIVISGHIEFEHILSRAGTVNGAFWNGWSAFLKAGHMRYIGYAYLLLTLAIVLLSLSRKRDYDEYQTSIFGKGVMAMGAALVLLFPIVLLMVLSIPAYAAETLLFLVTVHWSIVLSVDLIYVIRCR